MLGERRSSSSKLKRRENRIWVLMISPAMGFMIFMSIYPLFFNVYNSFFRWNLAKQQSREFLGLGNYIDALSDANFIRVIKNTLVFVFGAVSVEFVLGFFIALLFVSYRGKSRLIRSLMITPTMIAPIVASLMWLLMYNSDYGIIRRVIQLFGVANPPALLASQIWAMPAVIIVDIWQWTPYVMMCIYAGLVAIPKEINEAACVDGANTIQTLVHITLPSLKPVISVVLLMRIMDSFKSFEVIYMLTKGGPGNITETVSYFAYKVGFSFFEIGKTSAICLLILFIITFICQFFNKVIADEWTI